MLLVNRGRSRDLSSSTRREKERDYSNRFTIAAHVTAIVGTSLLVVHRKRARGNNSTNNIDRVRFFFTADFTTILSRVRFKWIDSRGQRNSSWSICESEMERVCSSNVSSNESTYVSSCLTMRNQVGNVFFLIKEKGSSSLGHGRKDGSCFVD